MGKRSKPEADLEALRQRAVALLDNFKAELEKQDLRKKVLALVPVVHAIRSLGASLVPATGSDAARTRIIQYLQQYPKQVIDGDELLVVSGIGEWARRVRELRQNFGWAIFSGTTFKDIADDPDQIADLLEIEKDIGVDPRSMKPSQYVLLSGVQDLQAAHRWNVLNDIRKSKAAVRDKILEYLRLNVGSAVSAEELKYLAKDRSEWARRARELRTDFGWPVKTKSSGRPDLPVATYVLEADRQAPVHDRKIPDAVRVEVLQRDSFCCVKPGCGWSYEDARKGDARTMLELHHVKEYAKGGGHVRGNLVTLCNVHHDEVHALKGDAPKWMKAAAEK